MNKPRTTKQFGCVYAIRCKANGRVYIGSSVDVINRIYTHYKELKEGRKARNTNADKLYVYPTWQEDYNKYGVEAFENYIIERDIPAAELHKREQYWEDEYRSFDPDYGYNSRVVIKRNPVVLDGMPPNASKGER